MAYRVRAVGASDKVCQSRLYKWQNVSDSFVQVVKCVRIIDLSGIVYQSLVEKRWWQSVQVAKRVRLVGRVGSSGKVCQVRWCKCKVCQVCWCKWQGVSDSLVQVAKWLVQVVNVSESLVQVAKFARVIGASGKVFQPRWIRVKVCQSRWYKWQSV